MKHTKGPWHLGQGNGEGSIFTDAETRMRMEDNGTTLYPICKIIDGWEKEEDEANARLIASAPELLEACKEVLDIINSYSHIPAQFKACQILQQAISKAEGLI